jgi:hypothetical protein
VLDSPLFLVVLIGVVAGRLVASIRNRRASESEAFTVPPQLKSSGAPARRRVIPRAPSDPRDANGWDSYWRQDLSSGGALTAFHDRFGADPHLLDLIRARGCKAILCVGNGLSSEAVVLASHGFEITALDLSPLATQTAVSLQHSTPSGVHTRPGAVLEFVCGDLFNSLACPGPFDVILERRTLQLYGTEDRALGLERLVARLASRGLFVSHVHMGWWRPGESGEHLAKAWLDGHGFSPDPDARRSYRLSVSTG